MLIRGMHPKETNQKILNKTKGKMYYCSLQQFSGRY